MILKDGSEIKDARFDRIVSFDERSRDHNVTLTVGVWSPRSWVWGCPTVLDQGAEGACVGFGMAHKLLSFPYMAPVPTVTARYAREKIYWEAQKVDTVPGGSYPGAEPVYEGTSLLAGVKAVKKLGWINGYEWAFSLDELILGVGYKGPAVLGLVWKSSMLTPDRSGYLRPKKGRTVGGHCIMCRGVNVTEKYFILRNSWGKEWGNAGDCLITFADMDYLLHQKGEAVFFIGKNSVK